MSNTLTTKQLRILQNLNARKQKGESLSDAEEGWRLEATLAFKDKRPIDNPPWVSTQSVLWYRPPESQPQMTSPESVAAADDFMAAKEKQTAAVEQDDAIAKDETEEAQDQLSPQQVHDEYQKALYALAEQQGIKSAVDRAREEWGEIYLNAIDGKVFAFRPFLFEDAGIVTENARAIDNHRAVAERCVVAGASNVFGKRPKFGVYTAIYNLIMDVSAPEPEVEFIIKG